MHFNTKERHQQALWHNWMASSVVISISSRGDLETLPQQALARNRWPPPSRARPAVVGDLESLPEQISCVTVWPPPSKSSTSTGGDLETLAQQALQCNCVVVAYIGNKI
ncbi:hypothetical protein AAY473_037232 [Plecturocebus cupreus]